MISRPFWLGRIKERWRKAPIVWLSVFRALHPVGKSLVVATNVAKPYTREAGGLTVTFTGLDGLTP